VRALVIVASQLHSRGRSFHSFTHAGVRSAASLTRAFVPQLLNSPAAIFIQIGGTNYIMVNGLTHPA